MRHYETTHIGFDAQGNEYVIDEYHDLPDLDDLQHGGAIDRGRPTFRTRDGHEVECLSPGTFSVRIPGAEDGIAVWTRSPPHV